MSSPALFISAGFHIVMWVCKCVCAGVVLGVGVEMKWWLLTHPTLDHCSVPAVKHSQPQIQVKAAHPQPLPSLYLWPERAKGGPDWDLWTSARIHFHQIQLSVYGFNSCRHNKVQTLTTKPLFLDSLVTLVSQIESFQPDVESLLNLLWPHENKLFITGTECTIQMDLPFIRLWRWSSQNGKHRGG